ncbi:hypothetical protein [Antrihabitans cavernicola]|uniref:Uncharacterized protein n=1 Tax=Antrihabitans cavernicola TaxID=2495913 RepID=A0A5A7S598_9NOCA|nr:hypothetical protein [Spelaeibacter cavernicola]KAA0017973.1 hypothetical protein FOY51_24610 [Spelaeibacter cavernicola]
MRSTTILTVLAGTAIVMGIASGTAAAATPLVDPGNGRLGVSLTPGETTAVSEGPVPALVERAFAGRTTGVRLAPGSSYSDSNGRIDTSLEDLFRETASHPGGYINAYLTDPNNPANQDVSLVITEHWN